jgi:hypothetical protein
MMGAGMGMLDGFGAPADAGDFASEFAGW